MKKILLIVPNLGIGGQEKIALDTVKILRNDYLIDIVVFERVLKEYSTDVNIINLNQGATENIFLKIVRVIKRNNLLKKLKKQSKYDIAYSFGDIANVSNALSKQNENCIVSVHGYGSVPQNKPLKIAFSYIFSKSTKVICVSKLICDKMQEATKLEKHKFAVVYNPYDIDGIIEKSKPIIKYEADTFVAVGRLEKVKGYENLLKAFKLVTEQKTNVRLVFVGDGSCKRELEQLRDDLSLKEVVEFAGMQDNPYPYLPGAKGFVLSSYSEGFPNAMIEALACSTPVVCVNCPSGPAEILGHQGDITEIIPYSCGVLCPEFYENDTENDKEKKQIQLAKGLIYLLENEDYYKKCGSNALNVAKKFDVLQYKKALEKLF